jgi:hypothetical protein
MEAKYWFDLNILAQQSIDILVCCILSYLLTFNEKMILKLLKPPPVVNPVPKSS